jgi:hypothetical protein
MNSILCYVSIRFLAIHMYVCIDQIKTYNYSNQSSNKSENVIDHYFQITVSIYTEVWCYHSIEARLRSFDN